MTEQTLLFHTSKNFLFGKKDCLYSINLNSSKKTPIDKNRHSIKHLQFSTGFYTRDL